MFVHWVLEALLLVSVDPQRALTEARVVAAPGTRLEPRFSPALSGTHGGRVEVHGGLDGVPLTQPLAKVWLGHDGSPLLTTARREMGPVRGGTSPTLTADQALARLEASGITGSHGATEATLMIDPGAAESRLVWRIDPPLDHATLSNPLFFVDAHDGTVQKVFDRTQRAQVEAYRVNPVETPEPELFDLHDVDETAEFLEGQYFRVRNCTLTDPEANCIYQPSLVADENGDFLYPVPDISVAAKNVARDDAYAEVSAYYNADRFQAWLANYGDPGLDCSQGDSQVVITVNQHDFANGQLVGFDNAFYTGSCTSTVVLGQGTNYDFAWDGEVVLHELTHGITDRQTGPNGSLGLPRRDAFSAGNDAGAINEGTSDYFGSLLSGDRIYSNYLGPEFYRDLGQPVTCPAGMPGEIHDDGILWATALRDITDVLGDDFPPVVIDTLGMLPLDVSFDEAAATLETLTRDALGDDAGDVVLEVFTERGMVECERVAAIEDVQWGMWMLPTSWDVNYNPVRPPPFQLRFEVPANAVNMTVTFEPFDFGVEDPDWLIDIVLKQDEPIVFTYDEAQGGLVYVDADSTEQGSFEDGTWSRPVQGGEILYAATFNRGTMMMQMRDLRVEYEVIDEGGSSSSTTGEPSSGTAADETGTPSETTGSSGDVPQDDSSSGGTEPSALDDDGGCGCHTSEGGPGALLLLLLGLGLRRRRD